MTERRIEELARKIGNSLTDEVEWEIIEETLRECADEQRAIDNKGYEELLQYLEELEAHYRDLGQYDDGKPIRRVVEYIESMKE